jgi:transposase
MRAQHSFIQNRRSLGYSTALVQTRSTEAICFNPFLYGTRNLVERFFDRIKHCRRVASRYNKLVVNYLAFVQLASIRLWLRVDESTS